MTCECGCGREVRKGLRFVKGHNGRRTDPEYVVAVSGCWEWQHVIGTDGYGKKRINRRFYVAHRWYYEQAKGPIPDGLEIDHLCRNRACVNPDHLEPVTRAENVQRGASAILTASEVAEIRAAPKAYGSGRALAERFGISQDTLYRVRSGSRSWQTT